MQWRKGQSQKERDCAFSQGGHEVKNKELRLEEGPGVHSLQSQGPGGTGRRGDYWEGQGLSQHILTGQWSLLLHRVYIPEENRPKRKGTKQ